MTDGELKDPIEKRGRGCEILRRPVGRVFSRRVWVVESPRSEVALDRTGAEASSRSVPQSRRGEDSCPEQDRRPGSRACPCPPITRATSRQPDPPSPVGASHRGQHSDLASSASRFVNAFARGDGLEGRSKALRPSTAASRSATAWTPLVVGSRRSRSSVAATATIACCASPLLVCTASVPSSEPPPNRTFDGSGGG